MELIITGKDFKLTPSLKEYVEERANRVYKLEKRVIKLKYELDVDHHHASGPIYRVEVWADIPGKDLQAGSKNEDMHEAIDRATDKLIRQFSTRKEKLLARRKSDRLS